MWNYPLDDSTTKLFQTQNQKVVQVSTFFHLRSIEIFSWRIKKCMMNPQHDESSIFKINYEVAELRLQYPTSNKRPSQRHTINTSSDAYDILKYNWSDQIDILEEFNVLFLDRRNKA